MIATLLLFVFLGKVTAWTALKVNSPYGRIEVARMMGQPSQEVDTNINESLHKDRRRIISGLGALSLGMYPKESLAGEGGAKITAAVTQSDLGQSVRRSVVKGAQVMDQLDQKAELFSDRFNLGAERSKRPGKPEPKVIPEPKPLDTRLAMRILEIQDQVFCSEANIDLKVLQTRIDSVWQKTRPAFERSGARLSEQGRMINAADFNFCSYTHFKSYLDLILERDISFPVFKKNFDRRLGKELFALTTLNAPQPLGIQKDATARMEALQETRALIDKICAFMIDAGLISLFDNADIESEGVEDWAADLADVTWSLAIDGDITLQSQLLLQDQGFRLYPSIGHLLVAHVLQTTLTGQEVAVEDYYMDTNYNSDPAKFEVKEVLLNIRLESL